MNISKIKIFSFAAIIATLAFVACKDDFSEEEFLKLQSDLALKDDSVKLIQQFKTIGLESEKQAASYLAALNEAGDLMQVTILVRADNKPVSGVQVSLTGASAPGVTNAEGIATFDRVRIGECTISLSKTGYTSATALVTFGSPGQPLPTTVSGGGYNGSTTTRYVPPAKRFENIGLPIFSLSANEGSTALITGNVTYEKDLTNDAPEIPAGMIITANFRDILLDVSKGGAAPQSSNSGYTEILSYQFAEGSLGVATVQANGSYEMRVPATVAGLNGITLNVPELVQDQTLVIATADNGTGALTPLANGPARVTNVLTRWSTVTPNASATVTVPTVKLFFPEPPAAGRGFSPMFTRVPRAISTGFYGDDGDNEETLSGTTILITNRGSGYTSSPTVTFTPASTTVARARIRGYVTSLSITGGGDYGNNGENVELELFATNADGTTTTLSGTRIDIQLVANGALPTGTVNVPTTGTGFNPATPFETLSNMTSLGFRVVPDGGGAPIMIVAGAFNPEFVTELHSIAIAEAGIYSSAPTISISGGGSSNQATAVVTEYRVQWATTLSSPSATTPYKVVPNAFDFALPTTTVSGAQIDADANLDIIGNLGNVLMLGATFKSVLTTDGTNLIVKPAYAGLTFRTTSSWDASPVLMIKDEVPEKGSGSVTINSSGQVSAVTIIKPGSGFNEASLGTTLQPVYTGAPGTGAVVTFTPTVDPSTKVVTTLTPSIVSAGSNYRANANRSSQNVTVDAIPLVKSGQTYKVDIKLGTGVRLTNVGGY